MSDAIESKIVTLRGQRVIIDSELAKLYGVSAKRLNEQVSRNRERFPGDFMIQLTIQEVTDMRSQFATASKRNARFRPYAFTEQRAIMVANVLNSKVAIDASIMLVRVFVKIRAVLIEHSELKQRLQYLEQRFMKGFAQHEEELREIRFLIARLEQPPEAKTRRIGFARDGD